MPTSDLTHAKRSVKPKQSSNALAPVRIIAISANDSVKCLTLEAKDHITETLRDLASHHPEVLADPNLQAAVVIEGVTSARLFKADTFRWLCGVGPDPTGRDRNWMGGAADSNMVDCKPEFGVAECAAKEHK